MRPWRRYVVRSGMLTQDEKVVIGILASVGISVEKIPESADRTPDLLAWDSDHRYLIEVKTRTDDETLTKEVREKGTAYRTRPVGRTEAVAGIFQHAMSQIDARASDELRLVWVCVRSGRGGEHTLAEQIRYTLYGISRVAGGGRGSGAPECYFFHNSSFYRYQHLDGAFITFQNRLILCLNTYSPRIDELRKSKLAHAFSRNILDPLQLEREGRCLVADCAHDRRKSSEVLDYVSTKYSITNPVHFNFNEYAAFAAVDSTTIDGIDADVDPWLDEGTDGFS